MEDVAWTLEGAPGYLCPAANRDTLLTTVRSCDGQHLVQVVACVEQAVHADCACGILGAWHCARRVQLLSCCWRGRVLWCCEDLERLEKRDKDKSRHECWTRVRLAALEILKMERQG